MKKISLMLVIGVLALTLVAGNVIFAEAAGKSDMSAMVSEEMTAKYLYTELAKKYPDYKIFANLAKSEACHIRALQRTAQRLGISVKDAKAAPIEIPGTKEEPLAFAMAYEQEDIKMLEKLIANEEDARLKRVLNNLLRGSKNHYNSLKRVADQGIDNLTCDKNNNRLRMGGKGQNGQRQGLQQGAKGKGLQQGAKGQRLQQGGNCGTCQFNCK